MGITLGILAFFAASTVLLATIQGAVMQRRRVYHNLRKVRALQLNPLDLRRTALAAPLPRRVIVPGIERMGRLARRLTPAGAVERLGRELAHAGSPVGWDAERVLAFKLLGGAVLGVGTLILAPAAGLAAFRALILAGMMGAGGYYLPDAVLRSRSGQRQELIRRALPDSLDLLSITVEAGLGFDAALDRVSRQVGGPLGEEFHRVIQEMQLGKVRAEALRDLGDRSSIAELRSFVMAMVQADSFGIAIAKVLAVQAREMRVKRRQRAEERAQKIPVKIVFPLIFCIFPALFVVLLGPAAIRIYHSLLSTI